MLVLALIALSLSAALYAFTALNGSLRLTERLNETTAMSRSQLWYWLWYARPAVSLSASGSTGTEARSIPVLLYHGEGGTSDMPLSVFVDQMRSLKQTGWRTITLDEFDRWEKGEIELPDKSFLLTFDDGRKDTYYQADPVLKDLGLNAVMFVITDFSLSPAERHPNFYLNRTELAGMAASGRWQLESHGDQDHATYAVQSTTDLSKTASTESGHFLSNKFWDNETGSFETDAAFAARVERDLQNSKALLEQAFESPVIAYAYPFNDFGQDTVNFPGSAGIIDGIVPQIYTYAFYQSWPGNGDTFNYPLANNGPGTRAYMEKRIEPLPSWSGSELVAALAAGSAKSLPYKPSDFGDEWVRAWGQALHGASLSLSASPKTSGANAFLNGSNWWSDYYVAAEMTVQSGTETSLFVRNVDDSHYFGCAFSKTQVMAQEQRGGDNIELARASARLGEGPAEVGAAVAGQRITCYLRGQSVVSAVAGMPPTGGIGVGVWRREPGTAHGTLTSITVSPSPPGQASGRVSLPEGLLGR